MDLQPAIAAVKDRIHRFQFALRILEQLQTDGDFSLTPTESPSEPRMDPPPAVLSRKAPKKSRRLASASKTVSSHKGAARATILGYISMHPNCKSKDIAKVTGLPMTTVSFWLNRMKRKGELVSSGKAMNMTYSLTVDSAGNSEAGPESDYGSKLECRLCHALCATEERLKRHMAKVHNMNG